jgi:hypothetical protein
LVIHGGKILSSGGTLTVTGLAYGGTLPVTNLGGPLAPGDWFRLFESGTHVGILHKSAVNLQAI